MGEDMYKWGDSCGERLIYLIRGGGIKLHRVFYVGDQFERSDRITATP